MPAFAFTSVEMEGTALLWEAHISKFDANGQPELRKVPEEINCWVKSESDASPASHGDTMTTETSRKDEIIVDRRITPRSQLWIGSLNEWNKGCRDGFILIVIVYSQQSDNLTGEVVMRTVHVEKAHEASKVR